MKQFLILVLSLISLYAFSQETVDGTLKNELGKPVVNASVLIVNIETDDIIAYDITDVNGYYSISIGKHLTEFMLNVRSMGYQTITELIENKTQTKDFIMVEEITILKEVIVRPSLIRQIGNSINYSVSAFAKDQDRSIGDAINRMPGIEVLSDGRVLYQGKPINKYYIEGLDLLEGKYNLANKNLPHKEVSTVQILENHQPIRILDSLEFSDRAALNIILKNEYTFTGKAEVGVGLLPLLWDVNITPMLFSKKRQMLSSYQTNNSGNDLAIQLKTLTIEDHIQQLENNSEKQAWLAIQQLQAPDFSKQRWLNNKVHMLSSNYLQRLNNDYELRINTSYLNDYQRQNGYTNTRFFIANNSISLFETKHNQFSNNTFETHITLQKNTKNKYLKNNIQFQGVWDTQKGSILTNDEALLQDLSSRYLKLSNQFKTIFSVGKQLLNLESYISINKTPESLRINPGQFTDIFNNGAFYEELYQDINLNSFYTNTSMTFSRGWKQFVFSPKIGFQLESQNLQSKIKTSLNQSLSEDFNNNLDWTKSKIFFDLKTQFKKNKWRIELTTPINIHSYKIKERNTKAGESLGLLTFEPRLSIIYDINTFWSLNTSVSIDNQFGKINQLHYAYIVKNYRNIQRINTPLPQMLSRTFTGGISYRNPFQSLFWSLFYSHVESKNNLLYQTKIAENGASELQALEQNNDRTNRTLTTQLSKYISTIRTNTSLKVNYSLQDFQQILNNRITDISNKNLGLNGKIDTDFTDWLNVEYQTNWMFSKNNSQNQSNAKVTQQNHYFNLNFYAKENQYLAIKAEYIKNNLFSENTKTIFTDLIYRYTIKKQNIDFELQLRNIFNAKDYKTVYIQEIYYMETNFRLRPRQALLNLRFSL